MTLEEAIKNIKEHCYFANLKPQAKEALDMGIKALEQEPILDKIKAEIERWHREGTNWSDMRLMEIEHIIDKYKAESEE